MGGWLRRIRGALGMGFTWAVAWGLLGFGIELIHNLWPNPVGAAVDIWPAALAYPAFAGGVVFSTVLAIAGRRRRFDELSLPRFATWGALGGLLVGLLPAAAVGVGLVTLNPGLDVWVIAATVSGPLILLGAASASGSLMIARRAEDRELIETGAGGDE